jgi:GT2 family glycosyltransferase
MTSRLPEVIVPIHDGYAALEPCLASLAGALPPGARVQLVDDASTDPRVATALERFATSARLEATVHHQPVNLGFVATVNAAMARATGDVVLLNSDTIVTAGWLQRLAACAASDPRIATATPFSNNAEICSFPEFCRANPVPADPDAVARACAASGPAEYPELPTAVGFCMLIRRAALDVVGDFDAATFGRGYGEENDFCLRGRARLAPRALRRRLRRPRRRRFVRAGRAGAGGREPAPAAGALSPLQCAHRRFHRA